MDENSTRQDMTNNSTWLPFYEPHFHASYDGCLIVLSVLIIATNAVVLFLFAKTPRLRTKTNCLLASLAVSDFGMGLFGIPIFVGCNSTYDASLCYGSAVSYRFVAVSTMLHILAVTVERYISIIFPLKYMAIVNRARVYGVIAVIWSFSLFIAMIQLSWKDLSTVQFNPLDKIQIMRQLVYDGFGVVVCFAIPFVIMVIIYAQMFVVIHRQLVDIRKQHIATGSVNCCPPIYTELRAISVFSTMLGIFAFCWVTWYVSIFEVPLGIVLFEDETVWMICDFLRFCTSVVNPLLYTYLKYDFRKVAKAFCCRCRRRTHHSSILKSQATQNCETQFSTYDHEDTKC